MKWLCPTCGTRGMVVDSRKRDGDRTWRRHACRFGHRWNTIDNHAAGDEPDSPPPAPVVEPAPPAKPPTMTREQIADRLEALHLERSLRDYQ